MSPRISRIWSTSSLVFATLADIYHMKEYAGALRCLCQGYGYFLDKRNTIAFSPFRYNGLVLFLLLIMLHPVNVIPKVYDIFHGCGYTGRSLRSMLMFYVASRVLSSTTSAILAELVAW